MDTLARYLNDESLSGPAARALSAIRTDNAKKVSVASPIASVPVLRRYNEDIIRAIADVQIADAENVLKVMLGSSDEYTRRFLYALSRVGSKASLSG